ncbi:MAG: dienelactone hydrolase family protein [Gemmatimonadaceae bacterium]
MTRPADTVAIEWIEVKVPLGGSLRAAVARPAHRERLPVVLLLHGSHGFAQEYVQLARDLASHRVIAIAACWFQGGAGAGTRFVTPIACPDAPPRSSSTSPAAQQAVSALVAAARALPGARADRVALVGHSRGGGAALHYALIAGHVQALVLNSTGYPPDVVARAPQLAVPVLLFHGTRDAPEDGGSSVTAVERAQTFESALRVAGKRVEVFYFDSGHNALFTNPTQRSATVQRIGDFLARELAP